MYVNSFGSLKGYNKQYFRPSARVKGYTPLRSPFRHFFHTPRFDDDDQSFVGYVSRLLPELHNSPYHALRQSHLLSTHRTITEAQARTANGQQHGGESYIKRAGWRMRSEFPCLCSLRRAAADNHESYRSSLWQPHLLLMR